MMVTLLYCLGDSDDVVESVLESKTGYPFIQIFFSKYLRLLRELPWKGSWRREINYSDFELTEGQTVLKVLLVRR